MGSRNAGELFEVQQIREKLADVALRVITLAAAPVLMLALTRQWEHGFKPVYLLHIGLYTVLATSALVSRRIPYSFKAWVVVGVPFMFGVAGLPFFGVAGTSPVLLLAFALLANIAFGMRAGIIAGLVGLCLFAVSGFLVCSGTVELVVDGGAYATSISAWATVGAGYALVATVLVLGSGYVVDQLVLSSRALRESEAKYRDLVDRAHDGVAIVQDGILMYANPRVGEMVGIDVEDGIGKPFDNFVSEEHREKVRDNYLRRMKGEKVPPNYEVEACRFDGSRFPVEVSSGTISYRGRPAVVAILRDLSDRLKHQQEQERLQRELRQVEKMQAIGQLAGGVAHDFNNQLAGIVGFADMLKTHLQDHDEAREYIRGIQTAAKRASNLTGQLLAFARKGKYLAEEVDLHKTIVEVVNLLRRSIDKRILIHQHLDASKSFTLGDPTQLQNAILNLALNARDAMPDGGELIFFTENVHLAEDYCREKAHQLEPGHYIKVSVRDTGTGIDAKVQSRMFDPFFTTKEQGKGTGMGLAAVYGTVKVHKGVIEVDSEPGRGTEIQILFPALEDASAQPSRPPGQPQEVQGAGHVLLVDDEQIVLTMGSRMLEQLGYRVSTCVDGAQAVDVYRERWREIDLVILDLVMPKMGGKEAFSHIKEINPAAKVLLTSGYSVDGEAQEILQEGAGGFLQKPYRLAELSESVSSLLGEE